MRKFLILLILILAYTQARIAVYENPVPPTFSVKFISYPFTNQTEKQQDVFEKCEIIEDGETQIHTIVNNDYINTLGESPIHIERMPQQMEHLVEFKGPYPEIIEVFGKDLNKIWKKVGQMCRTMFRATSGQESQDVVTKIHYSGPSSNRIDIVFMGDGYTIAEQKKHEEDMLRLYKDMFEGNTFKSYLPLFNVWSVYRPSRESGIGTHGRPRDTVYGLYRQGTELRGVYPSRPQNARDACKKTGQYACDFPTLIGNDDYYGGLGGEFTISTSSPTSGTIVLRHEFGHTMGRIGEEYDAGNYFGANYASTLAAVKSKWGRWAKDEIKAQKATIRINGYPWYDLAKGPLRMPFTSDGLYKRWYLKFSVSGCDTQDSINVTIDGKPLPWKTTGLLDRGFHEFFGSGFSKGNHVLEFRQITKPSGPIRQVCNVGLIEYMDDDEFNFDNDNVNAYPNFGSMRGFRPQNERCLMRNMTSDQFCEVCKENLWLQFLNRVNLIDNVTVNEVGDNVNVKLNVIPLGQFREGRQIPGEKYYITWIRNGNVRSDLTDKIAFNLPISDAIGNWEVKVVFETKEIRVNNGRVEFSKKFTIKKL